MLKVGIDANSGFCGGVIRAISTAEEYQRTHGGNLYSLGAIVHNEEELLRLGSLGIIAIGKDDLDRIPDASGKTVLIRAHGEPPEIYAKAASLGFEVIDCTCPVVLKLQRDIKAAYARLGALPTPGRIVLFGKIGHPEVLGLVGQVGGDAIVVENTGQLKEKLASGQLDPTLPVEVFSQTTMSPAAYRDLCDELRSRMEAPVTVHDTVCSQVAGRHRLLADFARSHDVVVFVSGRTSSNGRVLCELCRSVNGRTYHISRAEELDPAWFSPGDSVGVCGATSTPKWLLENVASAIENLH